MHFIIDTGMAGFIKSENPEIKLNQLTYIQKEVIISDVIIQRKRSESCQILILHVLQLSIYPKMSIPDSIVT